MHQRVSSYFPFLIRCPEDRVTLRGVPAIAHDLLRVHLIRTEQCTVRCGLHRTGGLSVEALESAIRDAHLYPDTTRSAALAMAESLGTSCGGVWKSEAAMMERRQAELPRVRSHVAHRADAVSRCCTPLRSLAFKGLEKNSLPRPQILEGRSEAPLTVTGVTVSPTVFYHQTPR